MNSKNYEENLENQKNSNAHRDPEGMEAVAGPVKTRDQVIAELAADSEVFGEFQKLPGDLREEFLEFAMGVRGLKVTYDPVFKKIFNPESHPEHLLFQRFADAPVRTGSGGETERT